MGIFFIAGMFRNLYILRFSNEQWLGFPMLPWRLNIYFYFIIQSYRVHKCWWNHTLQICFKLFSCPCVCPYHFPNPPPVQAAPQVPSGNPPAPLCCSPAAHGQVPWERSPMRLARTLHLGSKCTHWFKTNKQTNKQAWCSVAEFKAYPHDSEQVR